jgi:hypothetical protein
MKFLTIDQHQMLEDLTGLQHTRSGQIRTIQNRSESETKRLGLVSQYYRKLQQQPMPSKDDPDYKFKMLLRGYSANDL